jgi:hypothetical protein
MKIGDMLGMIPSLPKVKKLSQMTVSEYTQRFKSPALRAILNGAVGSQMTAMALMATLATFTSGDGGYPQGGRSPWR